MPHFLTGILFFRSTLKKHKGNVPLGWSVSGSVIQDHLVCSTSREPTILPWRRIHWFIWLVMTQAISDHWSSSGSSQRNTPKKILWKWRNDCRSEHNLCNCVKKPEKKFRTSMGFEPVTSRYRCDALPTELWSHWRWEQVNYCLFVRRLTLGVWYQKSDVRCLISEVWCQPSAVRSLISDAWCPLSDFRHLISNVWFQMCVVRPLILGVQYPTSDVRCLISGVW